MGTVVFWILFWVLVALLVFTGIRRDVTRRKKRRELIRSGYGSSEISQNDTSVFDTRPALYEHLKDRDQKDFYLDDITIGDLGLRHLYSRMNRCLTSAGSDMLYCFFCILPEDIKKSAGYFSRIQNYINDKEEAVKQLYILDSYGRRTDADEFFLITKLSDAVIKNFIKDIVLFVLLILAVVSVAFYPVPGIIATLVMLAVCIRTYFTGKAVMDENLKGLAVSLKLIRCAKALKEAGCREFDGYDDLFLLLRGDILIPYKDQSTSQPLSILFDYVRMITHIDLITYNIKISNIRQHIDRIRELYIKIGMTDALIAVSSYLFPRSYCMATVTKDMTIDAKGMYHPMVRRTPVCNDIHAERGIVLTGSNASGKSTFLKAVGLNVLFARSLGFAFADGFVTGAFSLYTSMALTDNILRGESYYVVEARSIKRICDAARDGSCLCIIDEVLRGTNTIERIAASCMILKSLCRPGVLCFAATHDLELAHLLKDDMDCYHFTEEIDGDNVTFPFILKEGISNTTNAIRLLSMLGFEKDIVSSADELVEYYKNTGKWERST